MYQGEKPYRRNNIFTPHSDPLGNWDKPFQKNNEVFDDFRRFQKEFSAVINFQKDEIKYGINQRRD